MSNIREDETVSEQERIELRRKKRKARRRRRIAALIFEFFLLIVVLGAAFVLSKWDKIAKRDIEAETNADIDREVEEAMSGFTTYALFGVDARDVKTMDKGTHGDVIMICSINNTTGEVRLASIYRDTLLAINKNNKLGKMTTAYYEGGAENAVSTLNRNFDLAISGYATVNWAAVAVAVNDLGGVEINVTDEMLSYKNQINGYITEIVKTTGIPSTQIKKAGKQQADGVQAVAYCRVRYKAGNDFGRTQRQREVLGQLLKKAKSNPLALNRVVDDVFPMTMTNVSEKEVVRMIGMLGKIHMGEDGTAGFPLDDTRRYATYKKGDVIVPNSLEKMAAELHTFLYGSEKYNPSPTVRAISGLLDSIK